VHAVLDATQAFRIDHVPGEEAAQDLRMSGGL